MGRSQLSLRNRQGIDSSNTGIAAVKFPTIAGTAQAGQALTGTNGQFAGTPTITIARQWLKNGVAINGATNATYVVQAGDVGARISLRNTATNDFGSGTSTSAATAAVIAA